MKVKGYLVYKEYLVHGHDKPARPVLYRTAWPNRLVYWRSLLADRWSTYTFEHREMEFPSARTFRLKERPWDRLIWKIVGKPHRDHHFPQTRIELEREQASVDWSYEDWDKIDAERKASEGS